MAECRAPYLGPPDCRVTYAERVGTLYTYTQVRWRSLPAACATHWLLFVRCPASVPVASARGVGTGRVP
jgi:hypothetical protein